MTNSNSRRATKKGGERYLSDPDGRRGQRRRRRQEEIGGGGVADQVRVDISRVSDRT